MAGIVTKRPIADSAKAPAVQEDSWTRRILIGLAALWSGLFLVLPLLNVVFESLRQGLATYWAALSEPDTLSAIKLTIFIACIAIPCNAVFGIAAAWAIGKYQFKGKALLLTLIDLPFAVSPIVAGLSFIMIFGAQGYLGPWLMDHEIRVVFAWPGMVIATSFVTFPFVARELIPLLQSQGIEQEHAALTLGASGWKTFWHVTLPSAKWALLYGVILAAARAVGEFGAVFVVSGRVSGETETMPLRIEKLYTEHHSAAAFAVASILCLSGLATLIFKSWLEHRQAQLEEAAQHVEISDEH